MLPGRDVTALRLHLELAVINDHSLMGASCAVKWNRVQCIRTAISKAIWKVISKVIAKQIRTGQAISKDF